MLLREGLNIFVSVFSCYGSSHLPSGGPNTRCPGSVGKRTYERRVNLVVAGEEQCLGRRRVTSATTRHP